jgi:hypothetical protein
MAAPQRGQCQTEELSAEALQVPASTSVEERTFRDSQRTTIRGLLSAIESPQRGPLIFLARVSQHEVLAFNG